MNKLQMKLRKTLMHNPRQLLRKMKNMHQLLKLIRYMQYILLLIRNIH